MITVLHYEWNKDPDVYFGVDRRTENKIIRGLVEEGLEVHRSTDDKWFGQSNPKYTIHHWDVTKKKGIDIHAQQKKY